MRPLPRIPIGLEEALTINDHDVSGTPRSTDQIQDALKAINAEITRIPTRIGADGTPFLLHATVIRDVLLAELARRR